MLCKQESLLHNGLHEHRIGFACYFLWIANLKITEYNKKRDKLHSDPNLTNGAN